MYLVEALGCLEAVGHAVLGVRHHVLVELALVGAQLGLDDVQVEEHLVAGLEVVVLERAGAGVAELRVERLADVPLQGALLERHPHEVNAVTLLLLGRSRLWQMFVHFHIMKQAGLPSVNRHPALFTTPLEGVMRKLIIQSNQIGDWNLLEEIPFEKGKPRRWRCRCKCGTTKEVKISTIVSGRSRSCRACADKAAKPSLEDRFWPRVQKTDGCWLWTGPKNQFGYGHMNSGRYHGNVRSSHRVSWLIHFGPIPPGLFVLHRCDNPPCVRPDHLFLGTQSDNLADMRAKGRWPAVKDTIQEKFVRSHERIVDMSRSACS